MQEIIDDLKKLDQEIEGAKKELAEYEGENKQLFKQASELLGIKTLEEMEEFINENSEKIITMENEITELYKDLKSQYEW